MCQTRTAPVSLPQCSCGCCACGSSSRDIFSTGEELKRLKRYRDQLENELSGIREKINKFAEA